MQRKGREVCASYLASFPGGPGAIGIFLRAGWTLGQIQQRYIFAGSGCVDELIGRNMSKKEFTALPAHFKPGIVGRMKCMQLTSQDTI